MLDAEFIFDGASEINYAPTFMEMLDWFFNREGGAEPIDDIVAFGDIAFTYEGSKYIMHVDAGCRVLTIDSIMGDPDWQGLDNELWISLESASEELGDNDEWDEDYLAEMNEQYGLA